MSCPGHAASTCRVELFAGAWRIAIDSVRVCHATSGNGSSGAGFNYITPNSDSIAIPGSVGNNHGGHDTPNFGPFAARQAQIAMGDIVEPFSYWKDTNLDGVIDSAEVHAYAGANLGATADPSGLSWSTIYGAAAGVTGASILASGCAGPVVTPPPTCGAGTIGTDPACVPIAVACPAGSTTATVSTDVNDDDKIDVHDCVAVPTACPAGTTGVFPICAPVTVQTCPAGTTGVFPICAPVTVQTCPA
ncbi:MAG: hypothetical protein H7287_05475, partial [Thermoleophilia bacterium]|nr:hypothetical protein [Thermoleophilia bacterium]